MKRLLALILALTVLTLWGCTQEPATNGPTTQNQTQTPTTEAAVSPPAQQPSQPPAHIPPTRPRPKDTLPLGKAGSVRIDYTIPVSSVRYITSVEQLPKNDAFAAYDHAYFETAALVLVTESVTSASIRVAIESVTLSEGVAHVTLLHESQGDVSTPAMTAWMIWAEVEPGLELRWEVDNPAMDSEINRE